MADQEEENPIRRDTIYRLYSQTKPVTAAAVMILVERGQLDLCQQVSEFLPGFKNPSVWAEGQARPAVREVQVHDLLRMGFRSWISGYQQRMRPPDRKGI